MLTGRSSKISTPNYGYIEVLKSLNCYEGNFQDRVEMCQTLIPMLETLFFLMKLHALVNVEYGCETNLHVTIESVMKSPNERSFLYVLWQVQ